MSTTRTLVLAIEGLPERHCWPVVPSYGDDQYSDTLRDPPAGTSATWDIVRQSATIGAWTADLAAEARWYLTAPRWIARVTEGAGTAASVTWTLDRAPSVAGISAGDLLICDRETVEVDIATESPPQIQVLRGRELSEATPHDPDAALWRVATPPALSGRRVWVWSVPRSGGSTADEADANLVLRGRIEAEPGSGDVQRVVLEVVERGADLPLGRDPRIFDVLPWTVYDVTEDRVRVTDPPHHAGGAYYLAPRGSVELHGVEPPYVVAVPWVDGVPRPSQGQLVWPRDASPATLPLPPGAYAMVWSDPRGPYPTFGALDGATYTPSANPAIIALNLLLSQPGDPGDNGAYDRGELLAEYSLQLDESMVDVAAWEALAARIDHVEADDLWLGGPETRQLERVLELLLRPLGITAATNSRGMWIPLLLDDVYPGEDTTAVSAIEGPSRHDVSGRPIEAIRLETDPGPEWRSHRTVLIRDATARGWYPRDHGGEERIGPVPYRHDELVHRRLELAALIAPRFRRLAMRLPRYRCALGPSASVEIGDALTLSDPLVRSPVTGTRPGATTARVLRADVRTVEGGTEILAALVDDGLRLARYCPSAEVVSYVSATRVVTVVERLYAPGGARDARQFAVGDQVWIASATGAAVSTPGADLAVSAVTDTTLTLGSAPSTDPSAGDVITYATYVRARDDGLASQAARHAWQAAGGLGGEVLGAADAPYVRGD